MDNIPIIDFTKLSTKNGRKPTRKDWDFVAAELGEALSTIGFAYVINHDIDQEKISRSFYTAKNFFEQTKEMKEKYRKDTTKSYHGYLCPDRELLHPDSSHEFRESYDYDTDPRTHFKNDIIDFDLANTELQSECRPLIMKILRTLAISLEMEDEEFFIKSSQYLNDPSITSTSSLRTVYYPPVDDDIAVNTVRCAEHSDFGILTILFQDDIGGLEVRTVDNKWISATPIPGSVLINTGDMLEFWSNGYFPATKHRVLIPEAEIRRKISRQSIAYFHHPDKSAVVTPLSTKKRINSETIYGTITAREYVQKLLDSTYQY